jgi:hypothetical protein
MGNRKVEFYKKLHRHNVLQDLAKNVDGSKLKLKISLNMFLNIPGVLTNND